MIAEVFVPKPVHVFAGGGVQAARREDVIEAPARSLPVTREEPAGILQAVTVQLAKDVRQIVFRQSAEHAAFGLVPSPGALAVGRDRAVICDVLAPCDDPTICAFDLGRVEIATQGARQGAGSRQSPEDAFERFDLQPSMRTAGRNVCGVQFDCAAWCIDHRRQQTLGPRQAAVFVGNSTHGPATGDQFAQAARAAIIRRKFARAAVNDEGKAVRLQVCFDLGRGARRDFLQGDQIGRSTEDRGDLC